MIDFGAVFQSFSGGFFNSAVALHDVAATLLVVALLSVYEFIIYRFISRRSYYSKQFNISLAIIPFFITTIVMALQLSIVITLGTIGALAIIRFRTAVKDPIDMVYLLWSIHNGILCGAGLFSIVVLTSLCVTVFLLVLELVPMRAPPYLLVVNAQTGADEEILSAVKDHAKYFQVKSRNVGHGRLDMIVELRAKNERELLAAVSGLQAVENVSLLSHDGNNFVA